MYGREWRGGYEKMTQLTYKKYFATLARQVKNSSFRLFQSK